METKIKFSLHPEKTSNPGKKIWKKRVYSDFSGKILFFFCTELEKEMFCDKIT